MKEKLQEVLKLLKEININEEINCEKDCLLYKGCQNNYCRCPISDCKEVLIKTFETRTWCSCSDTIENTFTGTKEELLNYIAQNIYFHNPEEFFYWLDNYAGKKWQEAISKSLLTPINAPSYDYYKFIEEYKAWIKKVAAPQYFLSDWKEKV